MEEIDFHAKEGAMIKVFPMHYFPFETTTSESVCHLMSENRLYNYTPEATMQITRFVERYAIN